MLEHNHNRHAGTASVLSFLFSGAGQLYNGQILKGLVIIFFSVLSMLMVVLGSIPVGLWLLGRFVFKSQLAWGLSLFGLGILFICLLGIYSIIDAYRAADKK
jgi:TM2 domain-containing membrane protein YozV